MIIFNNIKFKNFISVGNYWTEINFTKQQRTLIVGKNGAGKSTVLDAICFALFNKAFRNINKPELVNTITQKDMMVELEFTSGKKVYKIRRGIKPNIFEIFVDDVLLNQSADVRDYQEYLEKSVLKMNYKSFTQIVILGSANFTPFMQMPLASRRAIIEDLLDIQIFSTMSVILKERISQNKDSIVTNQNDINIVQAKLDLQRKHLEELKKNNDGLISDIERKIVAVKEKIENAIVSIQKMIEECEQLNTKNADTITNKIRELVRVKVSLEVKKETLFRNISFYQDNDSCPTCSQPINSEFKKDAIEKKAEKQEKIDSVLSEVNSKYETLTREFEEITEQNKIINDKQNTINYANRTLKTEEANLKQLEKELSVLKNKTKVFKEDKSFDAEMKVLELQKNKLAENRDYFSTAAILLKDGGIKTKIIRQYIPIMNKMINYYLSQMDLFVTFEFDENFNEMIKDRTVDNRTYSSFSQGEKTRIDLALLFTWRAISKMRNSASSNIIFFDEILDGPLDNAGTEDYIKLLEQLTAENNIFIISHKVDQLIEKFPAVLRFEKIKGFSKMEELV